MMLKVAFFAAFVALTASQQAIQQYTQNPYYNAPGNFLLPQGQQYFNFYGQSQSPFSFGIRHFKHLPFISLVNSQNEPLGYIYWDNSEAVLQQQQSFLPLRDSYGNLIGYYSLNQYRPGQQFQPQILQPNVISQLEQFGFIYNQPNQGNFGFLVVKNPYVFYYNENGVLRPSAFQNNFGFKFQFPNNFFRPNYYSQYQYQPQYYYGQYQSQYFPKFQGQYYPKYQFPYNYNYNQYFPTY